jgi:hypothetical protein
MAGVSTSSVPALSVICLYQIRTRTFVIAGGSHCLLSGQEIGTLSMDKDNMGNRDTDNRDRGRVGNPNPTKTALERKKR